MWAVKKCRLHMKILAKTHVLYYRKVVDFDRFRSEVISTLRDLHTILLANGDKK